MSEEETALERLWRHLGDSGIYWGTSVGELGGLVSETALGGSLRPSRSRRRRTDVPEVFNSSPDSVGGNLLSFEETLSGVEETETQVLEYQGVGVGGENL